MRYSRLAVDDKWVNHKRWHALLDPAKPLVYSCISMVPNQLEGPDVFRNELSILFCAGDKDIPFVQRCLFSCSCNEDVVGGKVVFGKFNLQRKGSNLLAFEKSECEECKQKVLRECM